MTPVKLFTRPWSFLLYAMMSVIAGCGGGNDGGGGKSGDGDGDGDGTSSPANVYGQVVLASEDELSDLALVEVRLLDDGDEVDSTSLDDGGIFEFLDLEQGDYALQIVYPSGLDGAEESAYRPFEARFSVDAPGTINLGRLALEVGEGAVSGTVSFSGAGGDQEAQVSLQGDNGSLQKSTRQGEFSFEGVRVGYYSLQVQRDGFTACEEPLTVSYHGEEVDSSPSLSSKAVTLSPSGSSNVNVAGNAWFLLDSSKTEVSVAISAPFARGARVWAEGSEVPDYADFTDDDALSIEDLESGRSTYRFQFRSECGLESEVFPVQFVRDGDAPVVDFVTINSGISVSRSRTMALSVSAHDDISGELEMRIAICDVSGTTVECTPELDDAPWEPYQFSRSVTFSDVSGDKRVLVQVRDRNQNTTEIFETNVTYDPDPPTGISLAVNEILVGGSNVIHDNFPLITISGEGISEMKVGLEAGLGGESWRPYQSAFRYEVPGEDGPYTFYFQFRDAALNETSIISVPFVMDRSGGLFGKVQLAGQSEHSGAQVALVGTSHIALTDPEGNFSISGVRAGRYPLLITKPNYKDHREGIVEIIAADNLDLGTIYLEDFQARILGSVVLEGFEGTQQHSGVNVRLVTGPDPLEDPSVLSDAVGNFSLLAPPGNYPSGLVFEKDGYETFVRLGDITLLPDGTFNVGEIFLTASDNSVIGTVRRAGEQSHTDIQVRLLAETGSENEGLELVTTTDATGAYRLDDVPLGPYRLYYQDLSSASRETYERTGVDVAPGPLLDMGLVTLRNRFININGSATLTRSQDVELTLGATDCLEMQVSNLSNFSDASWVPCSSPLPWTLTAGQGEKTVYARFLTGADPQNPTEPLSDTITLDSVAGLVNFTHDGGGRTLTQGSVVRFTATGNEPAALVEVAISGYETGIRLYDNGTNGDTTPGDNIYTRQFTISRTDDINNAPVTAYFTDAAGNMANLAGPTVTVAIDPLIYGIELSTSYANGTATVEFDTDEPTTALVEWGPVIDGTPSWDYSENLNTLATNHTATFGSGILVPAETYAVRITATDAAGNESTTAGSHQFSLLPSVPQRVVAIPGIGRNHLRWEVGSMSSVKGFNIYRSTSPGDANPTLLNNTPYNHEVFLYEDATVTNGTTYYYTVKSVDLLDNESEVSNESEATPQAASDGPTDVEGVLWGTTVWSEIHSPYIVNGTVSFEEQGENKAFWVVGPKTKIRVAQGEGFLVKGQIAMYGEDADSPNEAVYYSTDVAETSCTGTYGMRVEFGGDENENRVLEPEEADPNRSYDICDYSSASSYLYPPDSCDCGGASCMKWYIYGSRQEQYFIDDQCLYGYEGSASIGPRDAASNWRNVLITSGPAAAFDMKTGGYRIGNVLYRAAILENSNSYSAFDSTAGMFVHQSQFVNNGRAIYTHGTSSDPWAVPLVFTNNWVSGYGYNGQQVYANYSSALIANNAFSNRAGVYVYNIANVSRVNVRVHSNTFAPTGEQQPYNIYAYGNGTVTRNALENANVTAYAVDMADNSLSDATYISIQGDGQTRGRAVNNRVTHTPAGYTYTSYSDLYGNLIEHERPTTSRYHTVYTDGQAKLTGNSFFGDFTMGRVIEVNNYTASFRKNSFMITEANSSGGTGLALLVKPNEAQPNVQALDNYWGDVTTAEMDAGANPKDVTAIHDHYDDGDLVRVDYENWAADSFPMPWVVSPMYFSEYEPGEDVTFGGYGWDLEDAAAAGCPEVSPSDPDKSCPRDGIEYCPASCWLDEANLRWCATEDDCTGENQLHLGSSFTTQFNANGIHTVWMRAYDSGGKFVTVPWKIEVR